VIELIRLYLSFLPWLPVLLTPQIEFHPLHALSINFGCPLAPLALGIVAYCWLLGPLQCISLLFHFKLSCFELDFRLIECCLFGSCPSVEQLEIFCLMSRIVFVDFTSRLRQLPLHWDICSTVRPIANCLRGSSPVMEALRAATLICEVGFLGAK